MTEQTDSAVKAAATGAIGQCQGCGGLLFANVFHVCAANVELYRATIAPDVLSKLVAEGYVAPPPAASDSGVLSAPPEVTVKTDRTHCEHCNEPLDPTVYHKCAGNEEYKPPLQAAVMPDVSNYRGACPGVHVEGKVCKLCDNSGVIG
jgi:hypothetical protein